MSDRKHINAYADGSTAAQRAEQGITEAVALVRLTLHLDPDTARKVLAHLARHVERYGTGNVIASFTVPCDLERQ